MPSKLVIFLVVPIALVARTLDLRAEPAGPAEPAEPATSSERPWAENVPQVRQEQALLLYEEANKLFEDSQHAAALAKYREALKVWDHPAIRYNAAVALIYLDQPLAAYENLEAALHYGSAPFSVDTYQQALTYRKLLLGQLAEIEVSCDVSGAEVMLDGEALFVGPGRAARWLLPGAHQLVARKSGYLPDTRSLNLLAGKRSGERIALQEIRSAPITTTRRWAPWKPWAVVGAGVVVGLIGLPLDLAAKSNFNTFDAAVAECAKNSAAGCPAVSNAGGDAWDRGHVENIAAISFFAVGGALVAAGLAMAILNQPRVVPADERGQVSVTPFAGAGQVGLSLVLLR